MMNEEVEGEYAKCKSEYENWGTRRREFWEIEI